MRMVCKIDIKALKIIHGNVRGRVKAGGLVRRYCRFVIFLIYVKGIPMSRYAFYKIGYVK